MRTWLSSMATAVVGCLFLAGCQSFEPPERPVAYVFPTIRDMELADSAVECEVTAAQVRNWLERGGIWGDLVSAGMLSDDCDLVVRGLRRGGYAEIDARKCDLSLKWVSLSNLGKGRMELQMGYERSRGEGIHAGMTLLGNVPLETRSRCQLPGMAILRVWRGAVGTTERELVELKSQDSKGETADFWVKRLVFWRP